MPRAPRFFVDGAFYHVYGRIARGERVFADGDEASRLVEIVREVKRRDGLTIFGWCVMPTHYHLALRTSSIALWRSMRLIQWRFARAHNLHRRQLGPLWQGRYQVRMVDEDRYLLQLIAYIHLNPVTAGLVQDPAAYSWSGHRELLGRCRQPLVDVDTTLTLFGAQRSQARRSYVRMLQAERKQEWMAEAVRSLPWWSAGEETLESAGWDASPLPSLAHDTTAARMPDAGEYVRRACREVGVEPQAVASRAKSRDVAGARELIAVVGVERYGVRVGELAKVLGMHLGSVSRWITRAAARRLHDKAFAARCGELGRKLGQQ